MTTWAVTVQVEIGALAIEARYTVEARNWDSARREAIARVRRAFQQAQLPRASSARWDVRGTMP